MIDSFSTTTSRMIAKNYWNLSIHCGLRRRVDVFDGCQSKLNTDSSQRTWEEESATSSLLLISSKLLQALRRLSWLATQDPERGLLGKSSEDWLITKLLMTGTFQDIWSMTPWRWRRVGLTSKEFGLGKMKWTRWFSSFVILVGHYHRTTRCVTNSTILIAGGRHFIGWTSPTPLGQISTCGKLGVMSISRKKYRRGPTTLISGCRVSE